MRFGPCPVDDAVGAVLAHSTKLGTATLKKGRRLSADDVGRLKAGGIASVIVARLEAGDVTEDAAATRLARAAAGNDLGLDTAFTGRVNLYAEAAGVFVADPAAVNAANRVNPAMTLATLASHSTVAKGRMVATAKIIPFAVPETHLRLAEAAADKALNLHPFTARKVGLVATRLDHLKPATMDKTRRVLEARLTLSGSTIIAEDRVDHDTAAVAAAIATQVAAGVELLILFGASAVVDRDDVLPAAVEQAGGRILHFGMPVDPGNLLLLADINGLPVIGAPGCARSPKENGFDWVLDRFLAGLAVTQDDITGMGVGGLLMEITSRPQLRETRSPRTDPKVAAIILAAGKSSRMGGPNKLLAMLDGKSLVRHVGEAVRDGGFAQRILVTGHMADAVGAEIAGLDIETVFNPDFADGMASSIHAGMARVRDDIDAVVILLGDMPRVAAKHLHAMIARFATDPGCLIVTATASGKRGNPVLWDRQFFDPLSRLVGDVGARHLIAEHQEVVAEIEIGDGARLDLDTPEALLAAGGTLANNN